MKSMKLSHLALIGLTLVNIACAFVATGLVGNLSALTNKRDTDVTLRDGGASRALTPKN